MRLFLAHNLYQQCAGGGERDLLKAAGCYLNM
jgi:hypothetical protein